MHSYFFNVLHPEIYHGHQWRPPFFEGWYYKILDNGGDHRLAVIPGIFLSKKPSESHSFIQVLDGVSGQSYYQSYPKEAFHASREVFEITIGTSTFTADRLQLDLDTREVHLRGELRFSDLRPWPVSLLSPGIMGWYAWVPYMECFHGVVSMDHSIHGSIQFQNRSINFTGGRGYTEKDWGRSFPQGYIWMQTNHFSRPGISLSASMAIIPWVRQPFPGFIIGLLEDGQLYRFATYNQAGVLKLEVTDDWIHWVVRRKNLILEMTAKRARGGFLYAPTIEGMDRRIVESMDAEIKVQLRRRSNSGYQVLVEDTGRHAGLEAAGNVAGLIQLWQKRVRS